MRRFILALTIIAAAVLTRPVAAGACSPVPVPPWYLEDLRLHFDPAKPPLELRGRVEHGEVSIFRFRNASTIPFYIYDQPSPTSGPPPQPLFKVLGTHWFVWRADTQNWEFSSTEGLVTVLFPETPDIERDRTRMARPADAAPPSPTTRTLWWGYGTQAGVIDVTLTYALNPAYGLESFERYIGGLQACHRWGIESIMLPIALEGADQLATLLGE